MNESDKKSRSPSGFSEAPQVPFDGKPLSSDVSSWAQEIEKEIEAESLSDRTAAEWKRKAAGKAAEKTAKANKAKAKKASDPGVGEKRTGGGTIIGGSNDVKARVAAGLNPVAGLDVSAEDALDLASTSGVTATVAALSDLIEHGRDVM